MASAELIQDAQVVVDDVHMHYRVSSSDAAARKNTPRLQRGVNRLLGREPTVVVRALAGVSLVARAGEAIGVMGLNGSGKSTLLRSIAGVEQPRRGRVRTLTDPVLLGVGAALMPELSGAHNIRLGCLAMGMTPEQAAAAYKPVVELAGIGSAVHRPMKTYSSGMGARLRFAIATAASPRILLLDEALGTGDAAFKERSQDRMAELRAGAGCLFLVSHQPQAVVDICTRGVWLHRGRMVVDGPIEDVSERYRLWAWHVSQGNLRKAAPILEEAFRSGADTRISATPVLRPDTPPRHARSAISTTGARR